MAPLLDVRDLRTTFKTDDGAVETDKGVGLTPRTIEFVAGGAVDFIKEKHDKRSLVRKRQHF